jgi:DNA polymerase-3 subunit alpha
MGRLMRAASRDAEAAKDAEVSKEAETSGGAEVFTGAEVSTGDEASTETINENGDEQESAVVADAYRELHIRLRETAVQQEAGLFPLRDYLAGNPGPCSVFIHVPVTGGEAVIRTATQMSAAADSAHLEAITTCAGVADVWRV